MNGLRPTIYAAAASAYIIAAIQLVLVIVVSHILTPSDVGQYTIALSIITITAILADGGVNIFVIQKEGISVDHFRTCVTVSWCACLVCGLAIVGGILWYTAYHDKNTTVIMISILTARILIYPLGVISGAVIAKEMRYAALSFMNISNALTQLIVTCGCLFLNIGVISLAIGCLAGFVVEIVIKVSLESRHAVFRPALVHFKEVIRFGSLATLSSLIANLAGQGPPLVIGHFLGVADTGCYARALSLVGLVRRGIDGILSGGAIPAFAQAKHTGVRMDLAYVNATTLLTGVMWPMLLLVIVLANPIVGLLLGSQWGQVAPVAQILCLGTLFAAPALLADSLFLGSGRVQALLRREAFAQTVGLLAVVVGAQFSIVAVGAFFACAQLLQVIVAFYLLKVEIGVSLRQLCLANLPSMYVAAATGFAGFVGYAVCMRSSSCALQLVAGGAAGACAWLLSVRQLRHPVADEMARLIGRLSGKHDAWIRIVLPGRGRRG